MSCMRFFHLKQPPKCRHSLMLLLYSARCFIIKREKKKKIRKKKNNNPANEFIIYKSIYIPVFLYIGLVSIGYSYFVCSKNATMHFVIALLLQIANDLSGPKWSDWRISFLFCCFLWFLYQYYMKIIMNYVFTIYDICILKNTAQFISLFVTDIKF